MGGSKRDGSPKGDGRLGEGVPAEKGSGRSKKGEGGGSLGQAGRQNKGWRLVVGGRLNSEVRGQKRRVGGQEAKRGGRPKNRQRPRGSGGCKRVGGQEGFGSQRG